MDDVVTNHRKCLNEKKSWTELKSEIRLVRRNLSTISAKIPSYFEFKEIVTDSSHFFRIYFLSSVTSGRETTLLYCDVPMDPPNGKLETFQWQPLLESSFHFCHIPTQFSREEQLFCERKRVVIWGITSFDFQPSINRFVFPASGAVFYCDDDFSQTPPLFPHKLKHSSSVNSYLNPVMCPWNPNLIAYTSNYDLWVHNVVTSCDIRLTYARQGNPDLSDDPISAGVPSYITQEEFNRFTGFWWQPVSVPADGNVYRILYEEVDESDVDIIQLPCYGEEKEVESFRFPRPGTNNAKSTLKIVQFSLSAANEIQELPELHSSESLHSICPNIEYLARAGWTPDGKNVYAVAVDRTQSTAYLLLLPLCFFIEAEPSMECYSNHINSYPLPQVIYEEKSTVWINVHDVLYFFPQENKDEITFLWASEETGFRHMYLITVELSIADGQDCLSYNSRRVKKKVPLTSGEWEVSEMDFWLNEKQRIVFFIGLKDSPLERHLYCVSIDNPHEPMRLTTPGFSHNIAMNDDCTIFVSLQSSLGQTPFGQVYQLQYGEAYPFKVNVLPLGYFLEPTSMPVTFRQPELFTHRLRSGELIYGMLFKPNNMVSGEKYPTVLTIYGGPEVQLVTNSFKGIRHLRQYLLTSQGYVVVCVDCRGSRHRGTKFESHIKGRLGTVEIADQVEALMWLSDTTGIIDLKRIAVHGWSYGGYLSLMGLIQRPDIFKIAIAGAPVTSWMLYDTAYTERYMGTPSRNAMGYSLGNVLQYANEFPDEENRLLIIHGIKDENVHFTHTSQLINALVKAGKPYHLKVYPNERHSLRHLDSSEHYEATMISFLQQHL